MKPRASLIRFAKDRTGVSFIETALFLPFLLLLCCGVMDFGRVVYAGIEIANAARAGVQYGALTPGHSGDTDGMEEAAIADAGDLGKTVTASAGNFCMCGSSKVDCTTSCGLEKPAGYVTVTANYTFNTLFSYPGVPSQVALSRTAKMRVQ